MANLSISSIRERLFNPTKHEESVSRSSNPFAASSFKGNVLTADVFESKSSNQPGFTGAVPAKSKLIMSALVGSLSNMNNRWHSGIESIAAFGRRMKESASNFWNNMKDTSIELPFMKRLDDKLVASVEKLNSKLNSMLDTGISKKSIINLDLKNEVVVADTKALFLDKANAWANSMNDAVA